MPSVVLLRIKEELIAMCIVFFFFKQKTAYEMLRSLVGSEMCIRDRYQRRVRGTLVPCVMSAALATVLLAVAIAQVVEGRKAESSSYFPARLIMLAILSISRGESWILPLQLLVMSAIVWRGSSSAALPANRTPVANVLRCLLGALALYTLQTLAQRQSDSLAYLVTVNAVFAYMSAAVGDYSFHRFFWHAGWTLELTGVGRWMWQPLRINYVQHRAHHAHDKESKAILGELGPVPEERKQRLASQYPDDLRMQQGLSCTDHGITVGAPTENLPGFQCMLAFLMLHIATPAGTAVLAQCVVGNFGAAAAHAVALAIPAFLVTNHDKYHARDHVLEKWASAQSSWVRWFWTWSEMKLIMAEHKKHHVVEDRYHGLLPFNRWFVYPIWQQW
eukprot:TRINITY_DN15978_c0_g1_i4.p1 TRINITY_DN15978_c0_g1~~TRINITY_DN15978_c0_g1_i4.p1  ORF type:complete len:389 (+),score=89.04 TRINITY_DN15978_c0_g1_i4:60-1226(+)